MSPKNMPAKAKSGLRSPKQSAAKKSITKQNIQEEIGARAYLIWVEEGQPEGKSEEHWFRAEREILAQRSGLKNVTVTRRSRAGR